MGRKTRDIAGKRFGKLIAFRYSHKAKSGQHYWECFCDCGGQLTIRKNRLVDDGSMLSCGCARTRLGVPSPPSRKRTHPVWSQIKQRCYNPKCASYPGHKSKGIEMCPEWLDSFEAFYDDMGPKPLGKALGRLDLDRGYSRDNCIWAKRSELTEMRALLK